MFDVSVPAEPCLAKRVSSKEFIARLPLNNKNYFIELISISTGLIYDKIVNFYIY